jgi:hypothetical protein
MCVSFADPLPEIGQRRITGPTILPNRRTEVPSLIRLILTIGLLIGLGYAAMLALVTFVTPQPHEIIQTVPASRLNN